jgi:hypothetical protein
MIDRDVYRTFSAFFFNLTISSLRGIDPPSHPMMILGGETTQQLKTSFIGPFFLLTQDCGQQ